MTKTYISSLLTVLLFGGQLVQAQQGIEDAFAQIDAEENNTVITETNLISAGIEFFNEGKYDEAEAAFEAILNDDPYHRGAMKYLKKTARQIGAKGEQLQQVGREQIFATVDAAWNNVPLAR
ncbi:MAG TPA: hypothetical protein VIR77_04500, partial [Pontiella sp.]